MSFFSTTEGIHVGQATSYVHAWSNTGPAAVPIEFGNCVPVNNNVNVANIANEDQPKKSSVKRKRATFTSAQLVELEREFETNPYANRLRCAGIAYKLQLQENQTKVWFQNRRMKFKREHPELALLKFSRQEEPRQQHQQQEQHHQQQHHQQQQQPCLYQQHLQQPWQQLYHQQQHQQHLQQPWQQLFHPQQQHYHHQQQQQPPQQQPPQQQPPQQQPPQQQPPQQQLPQQQYEGDLFLTLEESSPIRDCSVGYSNSPNSISSMDSSTPSSLMDDLNEFNAATHYAGW